MKKLLIFTTVLLASFFMYFHPVTQVYADEKTNEDIEQDLNDSVNDSLNGLDFSSLESILSKLGTKEFQIFGESSFFTKLQKILTGEFADGNESLWQAIINLIFEDLLNLLPLIATVVAIAILCGLVDSLKPGNSSKGIGGIIHFVSYGVIVLILFNSVIEMLTLTANTISSMKYQMDAIFPILLTLLTAIGGTVSVSVYQPTVAFLSGTIINIFNIFLIPVFTFSLVFSLVSNLSNNVKLEKFSNFFNSLFKWTIGLVFTIFMAFASIQGITAGSFDGVSIRTAKFAMKSYIPILGGYLSDGFNLILASSVLIKNAVGAGGLLLLAATVLVPILKLIMFMLALKLMAGIIEPLSDSRIAGFISGLSKSIVMLIVMIIGVAFMYFIITGLIMCTANVL